RSRRRGAGRPRAIPRARPSQECGRAFPDRRALRRRTARGARRSRRATNRCRPRTLSMDLTQTLEIATCTDPGMVRSHNEDSIAADPANGLVVLADGMGGYNAGEVASGMATTVIVTEMRQILASARPYELDQKNNQAVEARMVRDQLLKAQ